MNPKQNQEMQRLPLLALRGLVVFPGSVVTLDVGREKSVAAVDEAMSGDRRLFAVAQRDSMTENPALEDLYSVGTVVSIRQIMPMPDQTVRLMVQGESRAILLSVQECGGWQQAQVAGQVVQLESEAPNLENRAYMRAIVALARELAKARGNSMPEFLQALEGEKLPGALCDAAAGNLISAIDVRQQVLECFDVHLRLEMTAQLLGQEMGILRLEEKIQQRVRESMDRANHEYYLREQMRAIQDELGEDEDEEIAEYRKKLEESAMPEEARDKVSRELRRLARTAAQSRSPASARTTSNTCWNCPGA